MKKKYQNGFFIFGIAVLIIMVTQLDFREAWQGLRRAGYWFFAVIALWGVLYIFNTKAWMIIIRSLQKDTTDKPISFWWLYKMTISGFALNYATPCGLMGGEPYRILALSPKIGTEKATASVILYVMTHIYSHIWFWLLSVFLYVITQPVNVFMGMILTAVTVFCLFCIWFFNKAYRNGLAMPVMKILQHLPGLKKWAHSLMEKNIDRIRLIDQHTTILRQQKPIRYLGAILVELFTRFASALEIMFVLLLIMPDVNYIQCVLILAFTSLFANMLFFMPLQLGGREGGFLMSVNGLGMSASAGIFVALIIRIRELIWTAIGLLLIKLEKKSK